METNNPEPLRPETSLITRYFDQLWRCIRTPSEFFRSLPADLSLGHALTFGLVTYWIGALLSYFWGQAFSFGIAELLKPLESFDSSGQLSKALNHNVFSWVFGVGAVALAPVFGLVGIVFEAFGIALALVLFAPKPSERTPGTPKASLEEAIRLVALSYTGKIFNAIPWVGGAVAWVSCLILIAKGAENRLKVSPGRGWLIALFPYIAGALFALLLAALLFGVFFWFFKGLVTS